MGLLYRETEIDNGRDMTHDYEGYAITPNDVLATYQAQVPAEYGSPRSAQAVIATATGNITVVLDHDGNTAVITVAVANIIIPVTFIQIKATGTTATGISALFRKGG